MSRPTYNEEQGEKPVAAVERALAILDAFGSESRGLSLAELSERTDLYKSTLLRLLQTLERFGYIERTPAGLYQIGPAPLRLGRIYQRSNELGEVAPAIMRRLVDGTGETACYFVRRGTVRMCAYRVDSPNLVRVHISVGDTFPVEQGASGRIFLAFSKPYLSRDSAIRRDLIASSSGELASGVAGICAPIFNERGEVTGALAVSGPESRFGKQARRRAAPLVIRAGFEISQRVFGDTARWYEAALPELSEALAP